MQQSHDTKIALAFIFSPRVSVVNMRRISGLRSRGQ
jgi:hypothetical protein